MSSVLIQYGVRPWALASPARISTFHPRLYVGFLVLLGLLVPARASFGQYGYSTYRPQAIRPSQESVARVAGLRGVGRSTSSQYLSRYSTNLPTPARSPTAFNLANNRPVSSPSRRGSVAKDHRISFGNRMAARPRHGSLMGASAIGSSPLYGGLGQGYAGLGNYGGQTALARSYSDSLKGNWATGVPTLISGGLQNAPNVRSYVNPDVVRKKFAENTTTAPAQGSPEDGAASADARNTVSLEALVSNQLGAGRKMHLDRGWEAFRRGDYQAACSEFALADGYSTAPADKTEVRLLLVYAGFAAQRYSEAAEHLKWVLDTYSRGGLGIDRPFASLVPDLVSNYRRRSELEAQLQALRTHVMRCEAILNAASADPNLRDDLARFSEAFIQARALRVAAEFAIPDTRSQALFEANAFATAPAPWNALAKLLQDKGLGQADPSGVPAPAGHPAVEFPFNLFQEAPPQDVALPSPP